MTQSLWSTVKVDQDFQDIRIVDLDVAKTTWSRIHESMRVVYLKLSAQPLDLVWEKYFFEDRNSRICIQHRGLWIEDGYISFDCLPQDIETFHIPDITRSVKYANKLYHEYVITRRRERELAREAEKDELGELEEMRKRLKF